MYVRFRCSKAVDDKRPQRVNSGHSGNWQRTWPKMDSSLLPIERATAEGARQLVLQYPTLPVRTAVHVAVMRQHRIDTALSFDATFERVPGITRRR